MGNRQKSTENFTHKSNTDNIMCEYQFDSNETDNNISQSDSDNDDLPGITFEYQFGCDLINDPFCCICFHDYYKGMKLQILTCNHIIHKNCMKTWYKKSPTCPICRINFTDQHN